MFLWKMSNVLLHFHVHYMLTKLRIFYNIVTCCLGNVTNNLWVLVSYFVLFEPFPWLSYNYSLYNLITQKPVTCLVVLNCSCRCNCSCKLFWTKLSLCWTGSELSTFCYPLKRVFGALDTEHYLDTTAASLFFTGETSVKVFIPVVKVLYLLVAAWTRLSGRCVAMDVCFDSDIKAFRYHAAIFSVDSETPV
jgi:hypothetical protein